MKNFNLGAYESCDPALCYTFNFLTDFPKLILDFEMSDEDPHNSNNRREKKSKLFRPHEITDGKFDPKRPSDWLKWPFNQHQFLIPFYNRCVRRLRAIKCVLQRR